MKSKILNLLSVSILALVLCMTLVSATLTVTPITLTFNNNNSQTINVESDSAGNITVDNSFTLNSMVFDITGNKTLDGSNKTILTITPQGDISDFDFNQEYSEVFSITKDSDSQTVTVNAKNNDYCESNPGSLELSIDDITVKQGFGDDDDYWYAFDEVEVDLIIENTNNDEKIKNIKIEWALYDDNGDKIMDGDEKKFDLGDDEEEEVTLKIKLDENIDELVDGTYTLYIKAAGEEQDDDDEFDVCDSQLESIDIVIQDDFVVINDIQVNGEKVEDELLSSTVSCGEELKITAEVWNIGGDDQDDVVVLIISNDLGLSEEIEFDTIDSLEDEKLEFSFVVPEGLEEGKNYMIEFNVYDEDNDLYETEEEEDKAKFKIYVKAGDSCSGGISEPKVLVSAVLESGGKAGKELVVRATISNTGDEMSTFTLNAAGYAEWASSAELDKEIIILTSGESTDVLITFDTNKDADGDKAFNIEVLSNNQLVASQPVSVTLTKSSSFASITGNIISGDNWYLWGIGALNIVLVIVIILVAIRIIRK